MKAGDVKKIIGIICSRKGEMADLAKVLIRELMGSNPSMLSYDVRKALRKGVNGKRPLVEDIKHDIEKVLCEQGVTRGDEKMLYAAINDGDLKFVKKLVEVDGVAVNPENVDESPLLFACANPPSPSNKEIVNYLISKGAKVNFAEKKHNLTPLIVAVMRQNRGAVRVLLEAGADTTITSNFELVLIRGVTGSPKTALDWARLSNHKTIVELLEGHEAKGKGGCGGSSIAERPTTKEEYRSLAAATLSRSLTRA